MFPASLNLGDWIDQKISVLSFFFGLYYNTCYSLDIHVAVVLILGNCTLAWQDYGMLVWNKCLNLHIIDCNSELADYIDIVC